MGIIISKLKIYEASQISEFNYIKNGIGTFSIEVYVMDINSSEIPYSANHHHGGTAFI